MASPTSPASPASFASSTPDQRQLRLIAAAAQVNESRLRDILAEDPPWTTTADRDALRLALQKVAGRGRLPLVRLMLEHGAEPNPRRDGEVPALVKAAEGGHTAIVEELLARGAATDWRGKTGQTVLFTAAVRGHEGVVRALLDAGASTAARDKEDRTPLLFVAADKGGKWRTEMLKLLLERGGADLEARDRIGRTPLLWAATNGNVRLADALLNGCLGRPADISAANARSRTALHLAAESNHVELVRVLLGHGADVRAVSDGGWTALHNAAQSGHARVVEPLLAAGADVNAELSNGMTPLHWAAFNGHEDVVRLLLTHEDTNLAVKDGFDRTPMLCAAERFHKDIVQMLSPVRHPGRLSPAAQQACEAFEATVVDFGTFRDGKKQLVFKHSVYELLYGWDDETEKPTVPTAKKNIKYFRDIPAFRWIHLPANNIAWVETLLAKWFVEGGHRDIEAFKALEKCFDQEHRGTFVHANFMRTFTHRISTPPSQLTDRDDRTLASLAEEATAMGAAASSEAGTDSVPKKSIDYRENGVVNAKAEGRKKKGKGEEIAERHPTRPRRSKGPPGKLTSALSWEMAKLPPTNDKMVLFMPFLHYETDDRRIAMAKAIESVAAGQPLPEKPSRDYMLIQAYLRNTPALHPRRTLDQFFYHGVDTRARDVDQVVQRHCRKHKIKPPKAFMVDQLWLWVLGRDLVITCFPQRWEQSRQDPLNVLEGIIEETNAKTRPPIQSAYDLAMLVTSRCSGMFDRHRLDDQRYQFLDMFESSIGDVTNQESELFENFNQASSRSAQWLSATHNKRGRLDRPAHSQLKAIERDPKILDALLAIGKEASLLGEIKDIRDELNILAVVLDSQALVLQEFETNLVDELRSENATRRGADAAVVEVRKRSREQSRLLEVHRKDIDRMDRQAESIYLSLTHLLDLKQKHSNALEARFARDQAVIAARQGQTIMVFTIVTIIFLPMSFIAAFFAINLQDWDDGRLTIAYVSKYMFSIGLGISIPLITMAFKVTNIFDAAKGLAVGIRDRFSGSRETQPDGDAADTAWDRDVYISMARASVGDEVPGWRARGFDGLSAQIRPSYEPDRVMSPVLLGMARPRKISAASANGGVSWAKPSFERGRSHLSDDLERGRTGAGSPSKGY